MVVGVRLLERSNLQLEDGDKLVGLLSTISDTMHVYITYLLVDPSYQNRKIGTKLLNMFEKHYVRFLTNAPIAK